MNDDVLNCYFNDFIGLLFKINTNLFYPKSMARATPNRLACHFGHACHRFASAALSYQLGLLVAHRAMIERLIFMSLAWTIALL